MRPAAGVFAAALVARLAFWRLQGTLPLAGDALEYDAFARSLVEAGRYLGPSGEAASRMPGYPLFLAGLRVLFGASPEAVIVAQCLLGGLTCVILLDLARRFVPEKWALACGLIAALYYDLIVPAAAPLSECLYSFLLVLSVWCLYHPSWKPLRRAVAFAALSACLYLVRPEPLPYIVCSIFLMPYIWAKFSRKEVLSALAVFALIVGVWVGRNFAVLGRFMPASSVGWTYVFIVPFWLLGCAVAARRKELWPVAGAVLCSLSVFTFFGGYASRYRQGVSPFIVLLAVAGMKAAYDAAGEKRFKVFTSAWLGANVLIWVFQGQARSAALWLRAVSWGH
ncbi:MAG: hypothetical protein HYX59_10815 [Elusimicrobia bacterium]|nr:hypothetical protein [Elusimicrobiota bacterium]